MCLFGAPSLAAPSLWPLLTRRSCQSSRPSAYSGASSTSSPVPDGFGAARANRYSIRSGCQELCAAGRGYQASQRPRTSRTASASVGSTCGFGGKATGWPAAFAAARTARRKRVPSSEWRRKRRSARASVGLSGGARLAGSGRVYSLTNALTSASRSCAGGGGRMLASRVRKWAPLSPDKLLGRFLGFGLDDRLEQFVRCE